MRPYRETKDPDETKDYSFDWSPSLVAAETIVGGPDVAFVDAAGTTNPSNSVAGGITRVWLAGGTNGGRAIFTVQVTTSGGRTLEEAFAVDIVDTVTGVAATAAVVVVPTRVEELAALVGAYQAAELAVLRNQSYEMPDGRKLVRANLAEIRKGRKEAETAYALAVGVPVARGQVRRFVNVSR